MSNLDAITLEEIYQLSIGPACISVDGARFRIIKALINDGSPDAVAGLREFIETETGLKYDDLAGYETYRQEQFHEGMRCIGTTKKGLQCRQWAKATRYLSFDEWLSAREGRYCGVHGADT